MSKQSTPYPPTMRAIVVSNFGPVETSLKMHTLVPTPSPAPGHAIIKIKAFGVNHAEMHMRRGEWAESMPIIGIECVGVVVSSEGDALRPGTPVATLMGGLGRTINGSYAEYTSARLENIVPLPHDVVGSLGWARLAALPETYATAWTCLFRNLDLQAGETLLVRGASSAFGRAAIALAREKGAVVMGTARSLSRSQNLLASGVQEVLLEPLVATGTQGKFDKILDLVGNSTVLSSVHLARRDGRVCLAGWLGGLDSVEFNPLLQKMSSGVHLSFFASFAFGEEGFPLSDVPLTTIARLAAEGKLDGAAPKRTWRFSEEEVQEAHRVMERGEAGGKMVVVVDEELQ
ncbi:alcohol dehydrogenase [Mycena indigotica]|uniref:Alcohol dehydrogenase n=1 Tax=Mycena indigotica TaxID=2126181 RepID=A0A8H6ST65_9AGAR|nr:alcohol dehydrogenase [Mycena indigotica]KAF7303505.1 alcohol dehydrogenase [Mycena indigotica]